MATGGPTRDAPRPRPYGRATPAGPPAGDNRLVLDRPPTEKRRGPRRPRGSAPAGTPAPCRPRAPRTSPGVLATLLAVAYALTAVALGTGKADDAAGAAVRAVSRGAAPSGYFGLRGRLVCVRPLNPDEPVAVENGPVPTGRPVLSFGATGEWIWLWDPARRQDGEMPQAFAVRREDVGLLPVRESRARRCPAV